MKYPNSLKLFNKHLNAPDTTLAAGEAKKICKTVSSLRAQLNGKHRQVTALMKTHFDKCYNQRRNAL